MEELFILVCDDTKEYIVSALIDYRGNWGDWVSGKGRSFIDYVTTKTWRNFPMRSFDLSSKDGDDKWCNIFGTYKDVTKTVVGKYNESRIVETDRLGLVNEG